MKHKKISEEIFKKFNNIIGSSKEKVNEELLFNSLTEAFNDLKKSFSGDYKIDVVHGNKYQVKFCQKNTYVKHVDPSRREIADLLFIVINEKRTSARVCYMQNKYLKDTNINKETFRADLIQFYLMEKRPIFKYKDVEYDIFNKAILPSITSYGVFLKNEKGEFDMKYYSSNNLKPLNMSKKTIIRSIKVINSKYCTNEYDGQTQAEYCNNLKCFIQNLFEGKIGEEFCIKQLSGIVADTETKKELQHIIPEINPLNRKKSDFALPSAKAIIIIQLN